jgi:hypothetical protein
MMKSKMKHLLTDSEKVAETCKEGVVVLQTLHGIVMSFKKAVVEKELEANFKKREREMKDLVDQEKERIEEKLYELRI